MNKMLKLPLFLGACGLACAGILAGVNAATKDTIATYKEDKIKNSYVKIFTKNGYSVTKDDLTPVSVLDLTDEVYDAGCRGSAIVESVNGIAYTCTVKGYAGDVEFQVAFAEGKYLGYTNISHNETSGYGADLIAGMTKLLINLGINEPLFGTEYASYINGASKTGKPVGEAIEACRKDYLAWFEKKTQENQEDAGGETNE